jgi:hypothetical protein
VVPPEGRAESINSFQRKGAKIAKFQVIDRQDGFPGLRPLQLCAFALETFPFPSCKLCYIPAHELGLLLFCLFLVLTRLRR